VLRLLLEPHDRVRRQGRGLTEQLPEHRLEVSHRQTLKVEPGEQTLSVHRHPRPWRQDLRLGLVAPPPLWNEYDGHDQSSGARRTANQFSDLDHGLRSGRQGSLPLKMKRALLLYVKVGVHQEAATAVEAAWSAQ
jgi:hypothetical protein